MMDQQWTDAKFTHEFVGDLLPNPPSSITFPRSLTFAPASSCTLAEIGSDGEVRIDWAAVDQLLAEPGSNPQMAIYARLMRACRDGTWKPVAKTGERKE